jgi:hypothetical protein
MDWLQFTAAVIGHLTWPVVIVILLIVLRGHLVSLADRLDKFKFGSAEVSFKDGLVEGLKNIIDAPPPPLPKPEPELPFDQPKEPKEHVKLGRHRTTDAAYVPKNLQGKELWDTTAAGQIITAYEQVDSVLFEIGDAVGIDAARASSIMITLTHKGVVSQELGKLYETIRDGRNLVAHARALPSESEVLEYVRQAGYLRDSLQFLKHKIDRGDVQI